MTEPHEFHVFLSYSRHSEASMEAAASLRTELGRSLRVFKDDDSIRGGDQWLNRLQQEVGRCGAFVVLVSPQGVRRWMSAETQVALRRHFDPHDHKDRLPIFPILVDGAQPSAMPEFLRLFQAQEWEKREAWQEQLARDVEERNLRRNVEPYAGEPYVGLNAFKSDQARLFFGRERETLQALSCLDTRETVNRPPIRWLEISGNSGSGKSSLMNAGLLPLVEAGWLYPTTAIEQWRIIGPMSPGERPIEMLAQVLSDAFEGEELLDICDKLDADDDRRLRLWLRSGGRKQPNTGYLLAIDQFEELFTFSNTDECARLDRQLAAALADPDCPLFLVSTVRADFLDRIDDLPALQGLRNDRRFAPYSLPKIGSPGLRAAIERPARLVGLDVREVTESLMSVADEPGALPLVENALLWLWKNREEDRLSGPLLSEHDGPAGILSEQADALLTSLGDQENTALELLFNLVKTGPDGRTHTRRALAFDRAVELAGGGDHGRDLIYRLSGRADPGSSQSLPVITISGSGPEQTAGDDAGQINLIHETLIRRKGTDETGVGYWPKLWNYLESHAERKARLQKLEADTLTWLQNGKRTGYTWSHVQVADLARAFDEPGPPLELSADAREFLGPIDVDGAQAELDQRETDHKRRLWLGDRLEVLGGDRGDLRPGAGLDEQGLPDIDWVEVLGGDFIYGEGDNKKSQSENTFRIARYPITNLQFQAFIDAGGYEEDRWWKDLNVNAELRTPQESRRPNANRPRTDVSWYEAVAFCRWLSAQLKIEVLLPTESQWEKAARGEDGRRYPWQEREDADWDPAQEPWRANTVESGLEGTTAVGMYPAGQSPFELLDVAGNVWEWCLNEYENPEQLGYSGDNARALRGGSWLYLAGRARCSYRRRGHPYSRYDSGGFRVLCSSPISDH